MFIEQLLGTRHCAKMSLTCFSALCLPAVCAPRCTPLGNRCLPYEKTPSTRMSTCEAHSNYLLAKRIKGDREGVLDKDSRLNDLSLRPSQLLGDLGPVTASLSLAFPGSEGLFLRGKPETLTRKCSEPTQEAALSLGPSEGAKVASSSLPSLWFPLVPGEAKVSWQSHPQGPAAHTQPPGQLWPAGLHLPRQLPASVKLEKPSRCPHVAV